MHPGWKTRAAVGLSLTVVACSASKSSNGSPTAPAVMTARVRTSDVLTGAPVSGATVSGAGLTGATTDSSGSLTLSTAQASTFAVDVASTAFITRSTLLKVPGADAAISLIKNDFDLTAFNQMFRTTTQNGVSVDGGLQRWTSTPSLTIVSNVLEFNNTGPTYTALAEALTPAEIDSIRADLSYGLPLLTGGTFGAFSAISTMPVSAGDAVTLLTDGRITFARCRDLTNIRGASGYGQWLYRNDDVVTGGMLCVDRDFELSGSTVGRGVRLHELGHALGYQHVAAAVKPNVLMNPTISINDLSPWDRDAARVAFQRPAGNRTPDRDPSSFSTNRLTTRVMTTDVCRARR